MTTIVCSHCRHKNIGVRPQDTQCENCDVLFPLPSQKQSSLPKTLFIEMSDYYAKKKEGMLASFSIKELADYYDEVIFKFSCKGLDLEQTISCKPHSIMKPHLEFTPQKGGRFILRIELDCINKSSRLDKYVSEATLPINSPADNLYYVINNTYSPDTSLTRGNVEFKSVDPSEFMKDPSNQCYEPQKIPLEKISSTILDPIDTGLFIFKQGGKLPKYWISTKNKVIFGRADAEKKGAPYLDEVDIPLSFFSENPKNDEKISRKHFEITRTDQGYVLSYAKVHPSRTLFINNDSDDTVRIMKGGDNGRTNNSYESTLLKKNDVITLCNMRESKDDTKPLLSYRVVSCQANEELCLVPESYSSQEECYILMPNKINLSAYIEKQVNTPDIELIHKNQCFYYHEKNSDIKQAITKGKVIKIQDVEFYLQ